MRIPDKLYDLAVEFRKNKLWNLFYEEEVMALELSDKKLAYIIIMGSNMEHFAFNAYIGTEGVKSYMRFIQEADSHGEDFLEKALSQECIQLSFENSIDIKDYEIEGFRSYKKRNDVKLTGANSFPSFRKLEKYRLPWAVQKKEDLKYFDEVLIFLNELSKMLKGKQKDDLKINFVPTTFDIKIPLFYKKNDSYEVKKMISFPKLTQDYKTPKRFNELQVARLKNIDNWKDINCKLVFFDSPIGDEGNKADFFTHVLFTTIEGDNLIVPFEPIKDFDDNQELMINKFLNSLVDIKVRPRNIYVEDERTYYLLEALAKKMGVNLIYKDYLEDLNELWHDMLFDLRYEHADEYKELKADREESLELLNDIELINSALNDILNMTDEEIKDIPDSIREEIINFVSQEGFPKEARDYFLNKLGK